MDKYLLQKNLVNVRNFSYFLCAFGLRKMLIRQQMQLACQSLLLVHGAGAKQFLQGLITKDMESLNSVPLVYSFLLNVRGRILADFFIYRLDGSDDETFVLETARERVGLLEKALRLYRLRKQIGIEPLLDKSVHFGIPAEAEEGAQKNSASVSTDWLADPRVPGFGFRSIRKTASEMQSDEKASASSAYLRHRLAWGLAEGEEMADQIPLNMNGDITGGVSFEKGCYIGQELVARTHFTGIVRRRLMPFQPIDRDVSRDGFLVDERGKRQGKIICSHGQLGGLCLASLDIIPPSDNQPSPVVRLFDSTGASVAVHRPKWWPRLS